MLEIQNVSKTFNAGTVNQKIALNGLNLKLNEGDFVTVIGGNGAGKSTMLNAVAAGPCCSTPPPPSTATMRPLWRTIWRSPIGAARPTTDRKERPPMRPLYLRRLVVPP